MALLDKLTAALHAPVRGVEAAPAARLAANTELKERLARRIAPELEAADFTYDGAYTWYGPWEDHSRRVVEARRLKGAGVCFVWGRCFDFLPVLAGDGKRLRYMRTDKAVGRQLMGPCRTWDESFSLLTDGPERLEADAAAALRRDKPLWEAWFRETEGLAACLREAERQRDNPYSSWPTPDYVRAFLLAALGQKQEGMAVMEAELDRMAAGGGPEVPGEVREKLLNKLRGLEVK